LLLPSEKLYTLSMAEKRRILFIDDNPTDRALISSLLTKYNFHVLLAVDGIIGLQMALEDKPDLILLDILLPHISGIELCKKIKENPITQDIPVVFYTSLDTPKDLINYSSYGAQDYIPKTLPPEQLIAEINSILK
jgi:DNA-binding response OmpR family regulator